MVRDYAVTSEEFLDAMLNCQTRQEFERLQRLYNTPMQDVKSYNLYASQIKITWPIFYATYDKEIEFGVGHFLTASMAISLEQPTIGKMWTKAPENKRSSVEDFQQELVMQMAVDYIANWDKEKNDNFHAYFSSWIIPTIFNEVTKDGEISDYIKNNYGYSVFSYDQLKSNPEITFDIEDKATDVERSAIESADRDPLLAGVANSSPETEGMMIKAAIFIQKMKEAFDAFSDPEIEAFSQAVMDHYEKGPVIEK